MHAYNHTPSSDDDPTTEGMGALFWMVMACGIVVVLLIGLAIYMKLYGS
ncbi:MAG: hypothetical protein O3A51_02565 [Verrucomicrobia bacterium]|nr:hypothetical protein [Verrucomicrobiota bacterium]